MIHERLATINSALSYYLRVDKMVEYDLRGLDSDIVSKLSIGSLKWPYSPKTKRFSGHAPGLVRISALEIELMGLYISRLSSWRGSSGNHAYTPSKHLNNQLKAKVPGRSLHHPRHNSLIWYHAILMHRIHYTSILRRIRLHPLHFLTNQGIFSSARAGRETFSRRGDVPMGKRGDAKRL